MEIRPKKQGWRAWQGTNVFIPWKALIKKATKWRLALYVPLGDFAPEGELFSGYLFYTKYDWCIRQRFMLYDKLNVSKE